MLLNNKIILRETRKNIGELIELHKEKDVCMWNLGYLRKASQFSTSILWILGILIISEFLSYLLFPNFKEIWYVFDGVVLFSLIIQVCNICSHKLKTYTKPISLNEYKPSFEKEGYVDLGKKLGGNK